jgi:ABC-2 type transport system permease protein
MTRSLGYVRFEVLRSFRNRRFLMFSLGFPLVLYLLIAGPNGSEQDIGGTGVSARLYFMVGLAAFGTMNGVVAAGGRIALERSVGWTRQLRITPLRTPTYIGTKLVTAYISAIGTILLLYVAGAALGVRLPAGEWVGMTALLLVGLLPFAALGIALGHVMTADSVGPAVGGLVALLAFLGGTWFPLGDGFLGTVGQALPSYWLVQASHIGVGGSAWSLKGWAIMAAWTVALTTLALWLYRRDTKRS